MKKINDLTTGRRGILVSGMLVVLFTIINCVLSFAYANEPIGEEEPCKTTYSRIHRKPVAPPQKGTGIPEETLEVIESLEPLEIHTYEVYLDRMMVYTKDTTAVLKALGNPMSVRKIEKGLHDQWEMNIQTDDVNAGVKLREVLKKIKGVTWVENFVYDKGNEFIPLPVIQVSLKNPEDSIKLRPYIDSFSLDAFKNIWSNYRWQLQFTPDTRASRIDIVKALINSHIPIEFITLDWDDPIGVIPEFTYDPYIQSQWGLYNLDNQTIPKRYKYTDLGVANAWNIATGRNVNICIIEQGIDIDNPDLKKQIKCCYDASNDKSSVSLKDDHGTMCAGIACAIRNNDYGISGVAPDANLLVATYKNKAVSVGGNSRSIAQQLELAIRWAVQNGADIISCSWGFVEKKEITDAINGAMKNGRNGKGCIIVSSSGNEGKNGGAITFPATLPGVMAIGCVDKNIVVDPGSSYGDCLFAVAPGVNLPVLMADGSVEFHSGTSLSCPAVAGVAALILEIYPEIEAHNLRKIIGETAILPPGVSATKQGEYGPWNNKYGYGLVNAYDAVVNAIMMRNGGYERVSVVPFPDISGVVE